MWLELQLNPNRYDLKAFDMHHYVITLKKLQNILNGI